MATANLSDFFRHLMRGMAAETLRNHSDPQLVDGALTGCEEAAFQAIIHRHGPMVYRVSWRVLQHTQDAEDAFQATFLILAQKLRTVRKHASLASWLHGVAHRVALKAKAQAAARRRHEHQASLPDTLPRDDVTWGELRSTLDLELTQLPDKWRLPLILCYLEGRTQDEAASQLGWSKSTLRRRLEQARDALSHRLTGRGMAWSAPMSAVLLSDCIASAAPTPALVASTVEAAAGVAAGKVATTAAVSAKVAALTQGVLKAMFLTKLKIGSVAVVALALLAVTFGGAWTSHSTAQDANAPPAKAVGKSTARTELPKLPGQWVWLDPDDNKHPFTIVVQDGGRSYLLTDHAQQTGTAVYNRTLNRYDVVAGPLKGYGFYIPELKKFVLVTDTGSIALYHEETPK